MIRTGGASKPLPMEGAICAGYGVPVIAPGTVRWVLCNGVPVDHVRAYSRSHGWVLCYFGRDALEVTPDGRAVEMRLDGRVEVA